MSGDVRLAVIVVLWAIVPGLPVGLALSRRLEWSLASAVPLGFAVTLGLVGTVAAVGTQVGYGLDAVTTGASLLAMALAIGAFALGRSGSYRAVGWQGLVMSASAGLAAFWQKPWFAYTADTFYHLAAARSLIAQNLTWVRDPLYGTGVKSLDPTSGAFHTWLAITSQRTAIPVETLFTMFTALSAALVVLALWVLIEHVSESPWAATIAVAGYAAFSMYGDFRMLGYPNRSSLALVFVALLGMIAYMERPRWESAGVALVGSLAVVFVHLGTTAMLVMLVSGVSFMALVRGIALRGSPDAFAAFKRVATLVAVIVLLSLPITVPRAMMVARAEKAQNVIPEKAREEVLVFLGDRIAFVRPGRLVGGGPIAFFIFTGLAIAAGRRAIEKSDDRALAVAGVALLPAVLLLDPLVVSLGIGVSYYSFARIALMLAPVPWIAAAWGVAEAVRSTGRRRLAFTITAGGFFVAHALASLPLARATYTHEVDSRVGESYTVAQSRQADVRDGWGRALWDVAAAVGDSYPRVAANKETGYYLAGLAPVAIVAAPGSHSPLAIEAETGQQRRDDMVALLAPTATAKERRAILERWDVQYVALSPGVGVDGPALESMRAQGDLFVPVVDTRRLVLLEVLPAEE